MSSLSAKTYSWGGEAGRFLCVGEVPTAVAVPEPLLDFSPILALLINARFDSSSVGGADDRDEESDSDIFL